MPDVPPPEELPNFEEQVRDILPSFTRGHAPGARTEAAIRIPPRASAELLEAAKIPAPEAHVVSRRRETARR